ncbi:ASCH domain-containing protein, partial [Streptomyces sp. NPDC041003]|uniref:ASCH domain-containing protein n=1 Tax=Streptomyces sp. NPDC041003 TaxID=3155730 RepID=UPI0033F7F1A9
QISDRRPADSARTHTIRRRQDRSKTHEPPSEAVRSGAKTKTTRFRDPAQPGPARLVFESDPEVVLPAEVTGIRHCLVSDLTNQDAQAEGLTTATQLREGLKSHYPDLAATDEVDVITFQINDKTGTA